MLGPWAPAWIVAATAFGLAMLAITVPLVRAPVVAVALAALVIVAALVAGARTAALERTALTADFGHAASGEVTVLAPSRLDPFGGRRVLVRWRGEHVLLRLPVWRAKLVPSVGEILRVRGGLRAPDLAARSVHAHATLRATDVARTGRSRGGALGAVDGIRRRAEAVLRRGLPTPEAALLRGMVLGDDSELPDELGDAFRATSLTHLTAASGQNIMLLAALALGLTMALGLSIRTRWALVLALIALYVPLAGGGPSIQRAGIMGLATIVAALASRPSSRWYVLLLAAAVTLALDPRALADAGWQLSFAAVIGIALLATTVRARLVDRRLPLAAAEAVAVTFAATVATAPLIAMRFDRTSLVALPANVLATPAVAPIMWLGMVAAAIGQVVPALAVPLVALAGLPLGYLVALARTAAALPGAQVPLPLMVVMILVGLAIVLATAPPAREQLARSRHPRRRFGVAAALAVALVAAIVPAYLGRRSLAPPPSGDFRITALDVGQGDATLLQAGGHAILVDAGPADGGAVTGLRAAGVSRLDVLAVTHPQADHDGGAPAVLAALPVDVLLDGRGQDRSATSVALDAPLQRRHVRVVPAHAGQELRVGPLELRVLWPPAGDAAPGADPNERAIVAVATAYGRRALLTADAESPQIAPLELEPVDVLKVSHHGSADPGLLALLQRLRPRVALIEVGRHNTYGHPNAATTTALAATVPVVRRTDTDGAVRVDLQGGRATVTATGSGRDARGGGRASGV
jgi:competence protein ComEC